ncbi:hypothetical protein Ae201684_017928 [Aphanomyces euteiches]|uniref:Uncharacterized protein n=1 Tax=Aphanomyces euteiches TaxID=100861 RepID=A0A6G0W739_9STRA|nr:hypothetical protein Ae201684_017928 [Aphanomyces euteiches]
MDGGDAEAGDNMQRCRCIEAVIDLDIVRGVSQSPLHWRIGGIRLADNIAGDFPRLAQIGSIDLRISLSPRRYGMESVWNKEARHEGHYHARVPSLQHGHTVFSVDLFKLTARLLQRLGAFFSQAATEFSGYAFVSFQLMPTKSQSHQTMPFESQIQICQANSSRSMGLTPSKEIKRTRSSYRRRPARAPSRQPSHFMLAQFNFNVSRQPSTANRSASSRRIRSNPS